MSSIIDVRFNQRRVLQRNIQNITNGTGYMPLQYNYLYYSNNSTYEIITRFCVHISGQKQGAIFFAKNKHNLKKKEFPSLVSFNYLQTEQSDFSYLLRGI